MASVTRTLNPLHFEDLEPHRFEDLVRQLAYDFRHWKSIEATGRLGGDDGMDIRAVEASLEVQPIEDQEADDQDVERADEWLWVIQCKRERKLGPSDLKRIVKEAVPSSETGVYGLIVAAACDFSKRSRDAAVANARVAGVQEILFWGKAELEDMLFQPKNDYLLFAYFGISLQIRRRSIKTSLRARLTTKRRAINILGGLRARPHTPVMIRDVASDDYPSISMPEIFLRRPHWKYYQFEGHQYPEHLVFMVKKYYALGDPQTKHWDIFEACNLGASWKTVAGLPEASLRKVSSGMVEHYWSTRPTSERGWFIRLGLIHYDSILAIDEHGDAFNAGPHLFVEFNETNGPFDWFNTRLEMGIHDSPTSWTPEPSKRQKLFPDVLPDVPIPGPPPDLAP